MNAKKNLNLRAGFWEFILTLGIFELAVLLGLLLDSFANGTRSDLILVAVVLSLLVSAFFGIIRVFGVTGRLAFYTEGMFE